MREIHTRRKNNFKDLLLNHIYENLKSYLIVIIIFPPEFPNKMLL